MNNTNRKKQKNAFPVLPLIIVIAFFIILRIFLSGHKSEDFFKYYNLTENKNAIVVNDEITDYSAETDDNDIYFQLDFIKQYIDPYIFWDEAEQKLTITTEDKVIRMKSDELDYYVNNEPLSLDMPFYIENNEPYIPSSILKELYDIRIKENDKSNIITIDFNNNDYYTAEAIKNTKITFNTEKPFININGNLKKGAYVYVYPDNSTDTLLKIRTDLGYTGYAPKKNFTEPELNKADEEQTEPEKNDSTIEGRINLTFEQVTTYAANNKFSQTVPDGVNVLSPTWFSFEDTDGNIRNIADKSYVDSAHENGAQVWALITDNFDSEISHNVLSLTSTREHVIRQLLAFVSLYELDGINIDFEAVPKNDGEYYIQFLRELAPLLKQQGAVLSVDMFVPRSWTEHYNRAEVAKIADYIIVMGYDEHYSGGGVSGSVASIDWSDEAIYATLEQDVPKEKLILGVPFYTRLWKEVTTESGLEITAKAYGMDEAKKIMEDNGAEFKWLEDIGQYYAEYTTDDATYKLWLEDERSMTLRLDLIKEYDIAGCASWKRGFESSNIWSVIKSELGSS